MKNIMCHVIYELYPCMSYFSVVPYYYLFQTTFTPRKM